MTNTLTADKGKLAAADKETLEAKRDEYRKLGIHLLSNPIWDENETIAKFNDQGGFVISNCVGYIVISIHELQQLEQAYQRITFGEVREYKPMKKGE